MTNSNMNDDKHRAGQADKGHDVNQKPDADRQRQQSTGQPGSGSQQGGQNANRTPQQGGMGSSNDQKGGRS